MASSTTYNISCRDYKLLIFSIKRQKSPRPLTFFFSFLFFTNFQLSVPSPDKGGGQINYGKKQGMGGPYDLLIVLSKNDCSRAEA